MDELNTINFLKAFMDFPLVYKPTQEECYDTLLELLHPEGLKCPNGHDLEYSGIQRQHRAPIVDYRCKKCGRVFNVFTGTILQGTKYDPQQLIKCMDGISRDIPINRLAKEMGVDRKGLAKTCSKIDSLMPKFRSFRREEEWKAIFREIEWWEIEAQDDNEGNRLVVKVRFGNCYALTLSSFDKIDPDTLRRRKKTGTHVTKLSKNYFLKKKEQK